MNTASTDGILTRAKSSRGRKPKPSRMPLASLTKMLKNKYRVCFLYCQRSQKDVY